METWIIWKNPYGMLCKDYWKLEDIRMTEKWIIENGEIKDTTTNMTFDSFVEILTVLNGQSRRITELASDNKRLKFQLNDCLNKKLFSRRELENENEQLKQRINSRLHFYRELYVSTNDDVVKRVVEDLEDILR